MEKRGGYIFWYSRSFLEKVNVTSDGVYVKNNAGETIATYSYDENGKRKSTTVAGETVYYYYDGDNVLYETNASNTILRSYTYNEKGHPLTMTTNGQTYYYLTNYHGDVIGLTDLGGNIVASYSYDAWGNILTQSGVLAEANPYRYASYRYDEQTKLYYLMARYYNPNNGAFLSVDPYRGDMDRPLSLNGYIYASNNPVNFIDPDGRKEVNVGHFGGGAVPFSLFKALTKGTGNLKDSIKKKSLGRGSTGRTTPNNLDEQLAMKEILSNPLDGAMAVPTRNMNDPRWLGTDGWVKMQRIIKTAKGKINIHFNFNTKTGKFDDFKFK